MGFPRAGSNPADCDFFLIFEGAIIIRVLTPVANLPLVSTTLAKLVAKFASGVVDTGAWCTLTCEYLREFSKKFETVLMGYSGAGGETDS
jgi:hypothetical protein